MTDAEKAYAAGIIDGEGCITTLYQKSNNSWTLQLSVEMTDAVVPKWFQQEFGGYLFVRQRPETWKYKLTTRWVAQGTRVLDVLTLVMPWLRIKKTQALLAIKLRQIVKETSLNTGPRTEARRLRGHRLRQALVTALKAVKRIPVNA